MREKWPIRILPLKEGEKRALVRGADDSTRAYQISFNLSARPDAKWVELFQTSWYQQYGGSAIPRLTGDTIQIASSIAELQIALSRLKLVVATANERYAALIEEKGKAAADAKRQTEDKKRSAEEAMSDALDRLQF